MTSEPKHPTPHGVVGTANLMELAERIREWERIGNVHAANGLVIKAKAAWRIADALEKHAKKSA